MPLYNSGISFIILFFIFLNNEVYSQNKVMETGEELKYEVSYGFVKLGYIKFVLSEARKEGKKMVYNIRMEAKTYPEVPFIKLNEIFESEAELTEEGFKTKRFYQTSFADKSITRTDYKFNYTKDIVDFTRDSDGRIQRKENIKIKDNVNYRDELCWIYGARINSFSHKNYNIPVFINEEESSVRYSYNANKTVTKIEKFDYDLSVFKLEGTCDFTGVFGYKGEFLVMISDDEYRVPVKAYFNSSLGNVVWELISYKKSKWSPPAFLK